MDWLIGITAFSVTAAVVSLWKMHSLKKDVYQFADEMEQALDHIITGKEIVCFDETKDTLWGKVSEKLERVNHIWSKKEEENIHKKEQLKGLISDISHQTRTPISNIKLYSELLQDENLSEKGQEFLANLEAQTEKLDFLLRSMVKMSRLETGSITIKSERQSLYQTIGQAVQEIVPATSGKQMELYVDCENNLCLKHDRKWTEEAIFNILDNAVKYTNPGGSIHIHAVQQEMYTKISIQDSGKGIPLERQAQIFTRFYREPEIHDVNGVGIGLFLAREIIELQNGYIEVHSQMGRGSEFCIYLPND